MRILIVDDYLVNLEIYQEYLKNIGVVCDIADSPAVGLQKMQWGNEAGSPYDVAIIDYHMPDMDGLEMGAVVKREPDKYGHPQLVLLTALDKSEGLQEVGMSGFCLNIIKPVYPNVLAESILRAMEFRKEEIVTMDELRSSPLIKHQLKQKKHSQFDINALVVDDFPANVEVAREMLEQLGCKVGTATNGNEAIELLEKNPEKYDIIFLDCQMPVMDGFKTTHEIRATQWGRDIPIIALTANTTKDAREKCLASGMNDYISKPMKISNISEMLDKHFPKRTDAA